MSAPGIAAGLGESPEVEIDDVPVTGELPPWLEGSLLRNGPGTFRVGQRRYRHWFDGLAMLHRFTIADSRVSYANRFLDTDAYRAARDEDRIAYSEFATDPCRSLFARAMAVFDPQVTDSAKVNIARIAEEFVALAETPIQVRFDPQTLETVGVAGWDRSDFGRMTTVHPHLDESRHEAINLVTRYGASSQYVFRRVDTGSGARAEDSPRAATPEPATRVGSVLDSGTTLATRRASQPAYIHSFGMSGRYLVLVEFPLVVNPLSLLLWLKPYIENFRWRPERGTRFHVFDRDTGGHVRSVTGPPVFAFHHVNAHDADGEVVVDMVAYDDASVIESFYLHRLEEPDVRIPPGTLRRFRVPLPRDNDAGGAAGAAGEGGGARGRGDGGGRADAPGPIRAETLSPTAIELPSLDYARMNTRPEHRYVYGVGLRGERGFYDQLVKIDIRERATATWHQDGCFPGEGVFVGRPGRDAEDDGVVLSVVLDAARGASFLLVLDAASFTERARAELPHPVLLGYHGQFYGDVRPASPEARGPR